MNSVKQGGSSNFSYQLCPLCTLSRQYWAPKSCVRRVQEFLSSSASALLASKETGQGRGSPRRLGRQPHRLLSHARRRKLAVRLSASALCRDQDWSAGPQGP